MSILIDAGASLSYVSLNLVEKCHSQSNKFKQSLLVQLATRAKRRVTAKIDNFHVILENQSIIVNQNILPLGLCDVLIGMDWLETH